MPKSRNRYARAQARARYRKPKRRGGSFGWNMGIALVAVVGIALLVWTVAGRRDQASAAPRAGDPTTGQAGDHWHASLDANVCGAWLPPAPQFETEAGNPQIRVGIHSHADGRFLTYGGWSASSDSLDLWAGADGKPVKVKNGDDCTQADGTKKKGTLTWYVNGKKQSGSPADYQPKDKDQISILFDPAGTTLDSLSADPAVGPPPNAKQVQQPSDETPYSTTPSAPPSS